MMHNKQKQSGLSLMEILVVIGIIAVLMGISIPAAKQLANSFEEGTGVRQLINAALSNARAIAASEGQYAGIRFQEDAEGNTYIIFIVHDPDPKPDGTDLAYGFRAVTGRKPMKLPEDVGVLSGAVNTEADLSGDINWRNAKTFSIVFSPQGKLTVHPVQVRNMNGYYDGYGSESVDTIFNIVDVVDAGKAMFYEDDYGPLDDTNLGLTKEDSVQSFIIYSKSELKNIPDTLRWSNYFKNLNPEYISPYTGELVMEYREQK